MVDETQQVNLLENRKERKDGIFKSDYSERLIRLHNFPLVSELTLYSISSPWGEYSTALAYSCT